MNIFVNRMVRPSKLDPHLYEEVEADSTAFGQAMGVVVLSSVAAGIGSYHLGGISGLITGIIFALVGWFIWAYITYFVGCGRKTPPRSPNKNRSRRATANHRLFKRSRPPQMATMVLLYRA